MYAESEDKKAAEKSLQLLRSIGDDKKDESLMELEKLVLNCCKNQPVKKGINKE